MGIVLFRGQLDKDLEEVGTKDPFLPDGVGSLYDNYRGSVSVAWSVLSLYMAESYNTYPDGDYLSWKY